MQTELLFSDIKELLSKFDLASSFVIGSSHNKEELIANVVDVDVVVIFKKLREDDLSRLKNDLQEFCKEYSNGYKLIVEIKSGPIKPIFSGKKIIQLHILLQETMDGYIKSYQSRPLFIYNHIKQHKHLTGKDIGDLVELPKLNIDDLLSGRRSFKELIEMLDNGKATNREPIFVNGKYTRKPIDHKLSKPEMLDFTVYVVIQSTRNFLIVTKDSNDYTKMNSFFPRFKGKIDYFVNLKNELNNGNYDFDINLVKSEAKEYLNLLVELCVEIKKSGPTVNFSP